MTDILLESVNLEAYINTALVLGLLGLGALIKHTKVAENVANRLIPVILTVCAIVFCIICGDNSTVPLLANNILSGIINAATAVGTHQLGKNIFLQARETTTETEDVEE